VGGAAACVDIGLFMLFAQGLGWPYLRVAAGSFVAATLVNYVLSVRFVFVSGARFSRRWEVVLVFAVSAVGLAINQMILAACVEIAGFNLLFAKLTSGTTSRGASWCSARRTTRARRGSARAPRGRPRGGRTPSSRPPGWRR
jgi:putative flippase GtrA